MSLSPSAAERPKVAYFVYCHPGEYDQITGGTWSNIAMLRSLSTVDVIVVTNHDAALVEELDRLGVRREVIPAELSYSGVGRSPARLLRTLASTVMFNARFFQAMRRERVQVVQCDETAATFMGFGARLAGCALVVAYRNYPGVVPKMKAYYKIPTVLADRIVATADVLREAIVTQGWLSPARRTECIYNGIDLDVVAKRRAELDRAKVRAELGIAEGEVALGIIASLVPVKKQAEFLEEVMPTLAPELEKRNARIHLIGGVKHDEYGDRCQAAIRNHDLGRVVKIVGYVRDMAPWYVALDVSVYPGIEGVARTLIESAAYELPIVALSGCGEAVIHGKTGLLAATRGELATPILRLASDGALRRTLGAGGKALAEERFDVRKNRERYEALYKELSARRPAAPPTGDRHG